MTTRSLEVGYFSHSIFTRAYMGLKGTEEGDPGGGGLVGALGARGLVLPGSTRSLEVGDLYYCMVEGTRANIEPKSEI